MLIQTRMVMTTGKTARRMVLQMLQMTLVPTPASMRTILWLSPLPGTQMRCCIPPRCVGSGVVHGV